MVERYRCLPGAGRLLVNTDLHGNLEDLARLQAIFEAQRKLEPETHWVLLGDLVHGPSPQARARSPELYDYPDRSFALVERVTALITQHPGHVHFVLGNHDHAHVGGPRTAKFYPDEAAHLEAQLLPAQADLLRALFEQALLVVVAPCGLLMSHGAPDRSLERLSALDSIGSLDSKTHDPAQRQILRGLLRAYGQSGEETAALLEQLSSPELQLRVVVHGHDKDEEGWFIEGENQLCPVIFGAPRANKRYLLVDLADRFERAQELVERALLPLYPD